MHGLVNSSFQLFVTHTYGLQMWEKCIQVAGLSITTFEGMLSYEDSYTQRLVDACTEALGRPSADVLEDFGTFIVSHPKFEPVRRLLRFSGVDFVDFLHSLDELDDRVRMAVAKLDLPKMELHAQEDGQYRLICHNSIDGYGHVMMGVLRAMADDYGALALLEHQGEEEGKQVLQIRLIENDFAEGRHFSLGGRCA